MMGPNFVILRSIAVDSKFDILFEILSQHLPLYIYSVTN